MNRVVSSNLYQLYHTVPLYVLYMQKKVNGFSNVDDIFDICNIRYTYDKVNGTDMTK